MLQDILIVFMSEFSAAAVVNFTDDQQHRLIG